MADHPRQDRDAGLKKVALGGRALTKYEPALALRICERIAEGETLKDICARITPEDQEAGKVQEFPARQTFNRWCVTYPECARAYATARELSAHSLEEEALGMARYIRDTGAMHVAATVRAYDVALAQLRWSAAKRNPRVYSERAAMSFTVPIQINTSIDLGGGAQAPDHPAVYDLEATVVEGGEDAKPTPADDETPLVKPKGRTRRRKDYGPRRRKSK